MPELDDDTDGERLGATPPGRPGRALGRDGMVSVRGTPREHAAGRRDRMLLDGGDRVLDDWGTVRLRWFTESHGGTTEFTWDGPLLRGVERSVSFSEQSRTDHGLRLTRATW